jgi:hypothetical protein
MALIAVVAGQAAAVITCAIEVVAFAHRPAGMTDLEMARLVGGAWMSHCCGSCALTSGPATSGPIPMCRLA